MTIYSANGVATTLVECMLHPPNADATAEPSLKETEAAFDLLFGTAAPRE